MMESKDKLLYDGNYYDVTQWIKKHPGGDIIKMYTTSGEDSTLAVQQFHHRSIKKVMSVMKSLPQEALNGNITNYKNTSNKLDFVKKERNDALTKDFLELYETLQNEGLFKPNLFHVFFRLLEVFAISALGVYLLQLQIISVNSMLVRILGILALSLGVGRSGWVMHEGAHHSLTGKPKLDREIQSFVFGILGGLSGSEWADHHNRHHAMPQHVKYDIDIQTLPLVAFHKDTVKNPKEGKGFLVQQQRWFFMTFGVLFITLLWKIYVHPVHCLRHKKYSDLLYMGLHYALFYHYSGGFVNYCAVIWLGSVYLIGNITLSHSHLPVTEEPTHWVEYGLTHTANIRSSTFGWVDYWMGNLNYQIEHHLFPTMPQYKNKLCRDRVKALAKKHDLPYHLYSYGEAVIKTIDNLESVAKELAMN